MEETWGSGRVRALGRVRVAGLLCIAGAAGWLVSGSVSPMASRWGEAAFAVWEVAWIAVQSLLLVGVIGLALSGAVALGTALLGRADLVAAEVGLFARARVYVFCGLLT